MKNKRQTSAKNSPVTAEGSVKLKRVVIANRGEIAWRIARTLRRLSITSIGIRPSNDPSALHVEGCDEWVDVDVPSPVRAFLEPERILQLARATGADSVHPGYGFLSESPLLANACQENGLTFIGPSAENLALFGDKARTKERAKSLGIPVVDTRIIDTEDANFVKTLAAIVETATFPLLVKARAGGGGRGMRLVREPKLLQKECESAAREAKTFFGDGTLLLEPYLEQIKHIEIQVAGDAHGNVLHLFERECSAQRNYQKILEEAPSQGVPRETLEKLYSDAVKLCSNISYQGLATVEFLVKGNGEYFFTEVNPRLQVEHTVTEEILGIDLVALQVHLARGEKLESFTPDLGRVAPKGHAIQARVNAETSYEFTPDTGTIQRLILPSPSPSLRIESGIREGLIVTSEYDSLLMKIIASGDSRRAATSNLLHALETLTIIGVETNGPFLRRCLAAPAWEDARYTTTFTEEVRSCSLPKDEAVSLHALAAFLSQAHFHAAANDSRPVENSSWSATDDFQMVGPRSYSFLATAGGKELSFTLTQGKDWTKCEGGRESQIHYRVRENSPESEKKEFLLSGVFAHGEQISFRIAGEQHSFIVSNFQDIHVDPHSFTAWVASKHLSSRVTLSLPRLKTLSTNKNHTASVITSPLPGKIVRVLVEEGRVVTPGTQLFLLESMKMEHHVTCMSESKVMKLFVAEGDTVRAGQQLAELDDQTDS